MAARGEWGVARTFAGLGVLLAVILFAAVIGALFDPDLESLAVKLYLQAALAVALVGVAILAVSGSSRERARALGLGSSERSPFVPVLIAIGMYLAAAIVIAALLEPEQEDVTRELGFGQSTLGDIASFVLIVIAAPLGEEIFFRGFLFAGIRHSAPFAVAALTAAGVWALFHYTGPGSWPVVLQLAAFGVVLSWLYERTGSLRAPIFLHALNNLIAFIVVTSA